MSLSLDSLEEGRLYSIDTNFFIKFDKEKSMMDKNKDRPYMFLYEENGMAIFVPLSTKINNYLRPEGIELTPQEEEKYKFKNPDHFPKVKTNTRDAVAVIPKVMPITDIYIKKEFAKNAKITDMELFNDIKQKSQDVLNKVRNNQHIPYKLKNIKSLCIELKHEMNNISMYQDFIKHSNQYSNKILIQKPKNENLNDKRDKRIIAYNASAREVAYIYPDKSLEKTPIGRHINSIADSIRIDSRDTMKIIEELNKKGLDVVFINEHGKATEYNHKPQEQAKEEVVMTDDVKNETEQTTNTQQVQSQTASHVQPSTPPEHVQPIQPPEQQINRNSLALFLTTPRCL